MSNDDISSENKPGLQKRVIAPGIGAASRFHFAQVHLRSAALFAQMSKKIEDASQRTQEDSALHWPYVTNSIMSSVAFVEAAINDIYADASDKEKFHTLDTEVSAKLAAMWQIESFRRGASILEKYQVALRLANKQEFNKGVNPYQDTALVIKLRNVLVHFVPQTVTFAALPGMDVEEVVHELEKHLKGKFSLNPLAAKIKAGGGIMGESHFETDFVALFFPDECLGYGCAKWTFDSCLAFADKFYSEIGVIPHHAAMRSIYAGKV